MIGRIIFALLLISYSVQTHIYLHAWRSDMTLWRHAVSLAPSKPGPWLNYGESMMATQPTAALAAFDAAERAAWQAHVPPYVRANVADALKLNRQLLRAYQRFRQ